VLDELDELDVKIWVLLVVSIWVLDDMDELLELEEWDWLTGS
jgi:hypothetical protein